MCCQRKQNKTESHISKITSQFSTFIQIHVLGISKIIVSSLNASIQFNHKSSLCCLVVTSMRWWLYLLFIAVKLKDIYMYIMPNLLVFFIKNINDSPLMHDTCAVACVPYAHIDTNFF